MDNHQRQQQRITSWIDRLENQAQTLMDGANLDELSAKERLDLAVKFIALKQRFILIEQQTTSGTPAGRTDVLLAAVMRQMRGEGGDEQSSTIALPPVNPEA